MTDGLPDEAVRAAAERLFFDFVHEDEGQPDDEHYMSAARSIIVAALPVLVEMLTAATDTAVQRGKQLDAIRWWHGRHFPAGICSVCRVLDGADGG